MHLSGFQFLSKFLIHDPYLESVGCYAYDHCSKNILLFFFVMLFHGIGCSFDFTCLCTYIIFIPAVIRNSYSQLFIVCIGSCCTIVCSYTLSIFAYYHKLYFVHVQYKTLPIIFIYQFV